MEFDEEKFESIALKKIDSKHIEELEEKAGTLEMEGKQYAVLPVNTIDLMRETFKEIVKEYVESL